MIYKAWESVPKNTLKQSWGELVPYLENVDQSDDTGSVIGAE